MVAEWFCPLPRSADEVWVSEGRGADFAALAAPLVARKYRERGFSAAPWEAHAGEEIILLAHQRGAIRGTLSLRLDHGELAAEDAYPHEVFRLRDQGWQLAEIIRFAVHAPDAGSVVSCALADAAWSLVRRHPAISCALIEVHPRHASFYQRRFGFDAIGPERHCPRAGAPSVLMALKFHDLRPHRERLMSDHTHSPALCGLSY